MSDQQIIFDLESDQQYNYSHQKSQRIICQQNNHNQYKQQQLSQNSIKQEAELKNTNNSNEQNLKYPKKLKFEFPIKLLNQKIIAGKNQFKALLKQQSAQKRLDNIWEFHKKKLSNNEYNISVSCKYCKAFIYYHQNKDCSWKLLKYKNKHAHIIQNQQAYKKLAGLAILENIQLTNLQLYDEINKNYPISKTDLIQIKRKLLKNSDFKLIKQLLKTLAYQFKYQHSTSDYSKQGYPQTLVIASFQQKTNYQRYGQCVSYDITYNCIKQVAHNGKRFGIGIFSGFDNNNRILIFGFSITTFQTINHFKNVFNWFFQLMGCNHTTSIITDQQQSIISAVQQLKIQNDYKYHHVYDNWHFIRTFTTYFKKQKKQFIKILINKLTKIMRESDPNVGEFKLKQFKEMMFKQNFQKQYEKVQSKLQHVCLWKMPNIFVGLSLHSNECLNDLLKIKVQYQTSLYKLIERLDKVSLQRVQKSKTNIQFQNYPFEIYCDDVRIKQVRNGFQKKVFNTFMYNYNRSQFYKIIKKEKQQYLLKHLLDDDQYLILNEYCSCGATQKMGVPCEHLIYLIKCQFPEKSYVGLFKLRWLIPQNKLEVVESFKNKKIGIN